MKLIENDDWSPCAKTSRVYILSRDKDPRLRDELKIRVGDSENFAHSLFYLASIKLQSALLSFFSSSLHSRNSYCIKYKIWAFGIQRSRVHPFLLRVVTSFLDIFNYYTKLQKRLSVFQFFFTNIVSHAWMFHWNIHYYVTRQSCGEKLCKSTFTGS